ncbi:MAG: hypothetical protein WB992_25510 [Bryobacteraceae bacterium]
MDAKFLQRVISAVESHIQTRPSLNEFELAYQARTACDRIRFAIKNIEQLGRHSAQLQESSLQLLDALERLESAERHFQHRFHMPAESSDESRASAHDRNGHSAVATQ